MTDTQTKSAQDLRRCAEEKACLDEAVDSQTLSLDDARQLVHELRVQQVELEMQNKGLRRTQQELGASRTRYFDLYDLAPVGYLTLSEQGLIQENNLATAALLGVEQNDLLDKPLTSFILPEDQDVYYLRRQQVLGTCELQAWEMRMLRTDGSTFWARLQAVSPYNSECWITLIDITRRRQMEDLLRKREDRYRLVVSSSAIWDWDVLNKRILYSSNWKSLHGYRDDELDDSEEVWTSCIHPQDAPRVLEALQAYFAGTIPVFAEEYRVRCKDGSYKWIRDQGQAQRDDAGRVVRMAGFEVDITERKRAEEELRKTNALLSLFMKHSPVYAYIKEVTSTESRVLQASDNFKQMVGIPGSALIGKTMAELFSPEFAAKITADDWAVVSGGDVQEFAEDLDGRSYITIKFPIAQEDQTLLAGYTIDITERKQAERVLQARLRISDYAFQHSLDDLLTKVLDEAEALTDSRIGFFHFVDADQVSLSLQAWSSKTLSSFCNAEGKGQHYPLESAGVWADCVREKRPLIHNSYDSLPRRKGLPPGHATVRRELVVPIFRNNLIVAVVGVGNKHADYTVQDIATLQHLANLAWDIVIRKRVEDDLLRAKEAAETANRAKSDFLATMSHEIRTPLGAMLGNIELLEVSSLTPSQQEYLNDCKTASQMLLQVINDILEFSKIEAGKLELVNETFSVSSMSRHLVRMFSAGALHKGLELTISLAEDLPAYISGDQQRLRQIIANLLSNAIKFTRQGTVSLEITLEQPPSATTPDKAVLRIVVSDTGIGIPCEKQDHVFDSFTQLESFSARTRNGTGLGLPICRRLLSLMGGSITVSSVAGEGSVFTVLLPVTICQTSAQAQAQSRTQPPASSRRILLADDDERGRTVAQKLLQRRGYRVTTVENGSELLDALQNEAFEIVLTDISMPDMDGTQVARIIRSGERSGIDPRIPIIAMTAHAFTEDRERFLHAGISGYLAKPVNLEELFRQIEELCTKGQS